jgi:hypothetical protein
MRRSTIALAVLAVALAVPAAAGAKGYVAASVCGETGCHPVEPAAVRTGFESFTPASAPDGAEPFLKIHLRERMASGKVVEVYDLDWLPRAGLTRGDGERLWARPGPVLDRALRRAAAGLEQSGGRARLGRRRRAAGPRRRGVLARTGRRQTPGRRARGDRSRPPRGRGARHRRPPPYRERAARRHAAYPPALTPRAAG